MTNIKLSSVDKIYREAINDLYAVDRSRHIFSKPEAVNLGVLRLNYELGEYHLDVGGQWQNMGYAIDLSFVCSGQKYNASFSKYGDFGAFSIFYAGGSLLYDTYNVVSDRDMVVKKLNSFDHTFYRLVYAVALAFVDVSEEERLKL